MEDLEEDCDVYYMRAMKVGNLLEPYCKYGDFPIIVYGFEKGTDFERVKKVVDETLERDGYKFITFIDKPSEN